MAQEQAVETRDDAAFVAIPLTSLRLDRITNFDIFFRPRPDQPLVLYAERNIQFTDDVRRRLIDHRLKSVYIRADQRLDYTRYLEDNLREIIVDTTLPLTEKTQMLYASACGVVESVLMNPQSLEGIQRSKEMIKLSVGFLLQDKKVFRCLLDAISSDYHIYSHSVNVVTYSVALANQAGHSAPATLREIALGALLHDVGKSDIDPAILNKPGPLTENEWIIMREHCRAGYDMLSSTDRLGEIALDIVLHHHENLRGTGYPDGLAGDMVSPFVRIVAVADMFDALTTERPWQQARTSFDALSLMKEHVDVEVDRQLFRIFVNMMGQLEA